MATLTLGDIDEVLSARLHQNNDNLLELSIRRKGENGTEWFLSSGIASRTLRSNKFRTFFQSINSSIETVDDLKTYLRENDEENDDNGDNDNDDVDVADEDEDKQEDDSKNDNNDNQISIDMLNSGSMPVFPRNTFLASPINGANWQFVTNLGFDSGNFMKLSDQRFYFVCFRCLCFVRGKLWMFFVDSSLPEPKARDLGLISHKEHYHHSWTYSFKLTNNTTEKTPIVPIETGIFDPNNPQI